MGLNPRKERESAMNKNRIIACLLLLTFTIPAFAFEVDEFKSGMDHEKIKELLKSWNFDKVQEFSKDTLIAYDLGSKGTNRQIIFNFCNDKLVGIEQEIKPSLKNFITIASNFNAKYGQPSKVEADNNVISTGEKNTLALFWRKGLDTVGIRLLLLSSNDQILLSHQVPNICWPAPR
jgi:hypothetical protein